MYVPNWQHPWQRVTEYVIQHMLPLCFRIFVFAWNSHLSWNLLYWTCDYLTILGLNLNHVSNGAPVITYIDVEKNNGCDWYEMLNIFVKHMP